MTEAIDKRIAELQKKLAARKGKAPYIDNCKAIEAEIARLEGMKEQAARAAAEASEKVAGVKPKGKAS